MNWSIRPQGKPGDKRRVVKFAYLPKKVIGSNGRIDRIWLSKYISYQKLVVDHKFENYEFVYFNKWKEYAASFFSESIECTKS